MELFTWAALAAYPGLTLATNLIVSYTKHLAEKRRPWKDWGTDLYAVAVAFFLICIATAAMIWETKPKLSSLLDWFLLVFFGLLLAAVNAFIVAAGAGKANDKAVAAYEAKKARQGEPLPPNPQPVPTMPPPATGSPGNNSPGNTDGM